MDRLAKFISNLRSFFVAQLSVAVIILIFGNALFNGRSPVQGLVTPDKLLNGEFALLALALAVLGMALYGTTTSSTVTLTEENYDTVHHVMKATEQLTGSPVFFRSAEFDGSGGFVNVLLGNYCHRVDFTHDEAGRLLVRPESADEYIEAPLPTIGAVA